MRPCPHCEAPIKDEIICPSCGQSTALSGSAASLAEVPTEIKGWNWGAFFLTWIWGIGNRVWIALLGLIPYVNIVAAIVLGIKGNEWAWKNKQWESVEQFKKTQRKWAWWGLVIFMASIAIGVIVMLRFRD